MAEDELLALYWTVSRSGRGARRAANGACSTGATAAPRPPASGSRGIGLWHADIEHQLETRTLARDEGRSSTTPGCAYLQVEFLADFFVAPATARSGRVRPRPPAAVRHRRGVRCPPHQGRATSPARRASWPQLTERSPSCARTRPSTRRARSSTSSCRSTSTSTRSTRRSSSSADAGAANGGLAIDTWHMAKLGIAPDDLRQIAPEYLIAWVELSRRPVREHARSRRRDRQPPPAARARASSTSPPTSRSARRSATRARGASRCSRRSCAACRSSRSSTGRTRRPPRSSAPASREREAKEATVSSDRQAPVSTASG